MDADQALHLAAFSIASASRSFATICSGLCSFLRFDVIESLLPRGGVDLHTAWIWISNAGYAHDDRDVFQASPEELPVIDIHRL